MVIYMFTIQMLGPVQIQQDKDHKERKDCKDYKAILGHVELKATLEISGLADSQEKLERKAILGHAELKATKAILVRPGPLDLLVLMAQTVNKVSVDSEEFRARLEHRDHKATLALMAQKVHKDHKDYVD